MGCRHRGLARVAAEGLAFRQAADDGVEGGNTVHQPRLHRGPADEDPALGHAFQNVLHIDPAVPGHVGDESAVDRIHLVLHVGTALGGEGAILRGDALELPSRDLGGLHATLGLGAGHVGVRCHDADGADLRGVPADENAISRGGDPVGGRRDHAVGVGHDGLHPAVAGDQAGQFLGPVHGTAGGVHRQHHGPHLRVLHGANELIGREGGGGAAADLHEQVHALGNDTLDG